MLADLLHTVKYRHMASPRTDDTTLSGIHILLVEDDLDTLELLATVLRYCGAQVIPVASAEDALQRLAAIRPHVLVSDISMPDKDGFWLLRQLRDRQHTADIPAIAVTAIAHPDAVTAAGFAAFLAKPVDPDDLCLTIRAVLDSRALEPDR
jgi:CheY-like chemotaxis protein